MKSILRMLLLACSLLMLTACGKYYGVSVDAMNDGMPHTPGPIVISPGTPEVTPDDLWFRELAGAVAPAFESRGYRVTDKINEAEYAAFISDKMGEPDVRTNTVMMPHSYPVQRGHGKHRRTEYITYYEPVTTTTVSYTYELNIDTYTLTKKKKKGPQVWKIRMCSTGGTPNTRTLLYTMTQVLPQVLGTHSHGVQGYQVFLGNEGEVEVKPIY